MRFKNLNQRQIFYEGSDNKPKGDYYSATT
jgi:hypothetical protein